MLNRLLPPSRQPKHWFSRARAIAFAAAGAMAALTGGLVLAAAIGWMSPTGAVFAIFSLLPLAALLLVQTLARIQEVVIMRSGGLAIDTGDDDG